MARYDRVIPPGGMGNITVTIDSGKVRGDFLKKAIIWSNDLQRMSVTLYLVGEVIPHISLDPGGYLSLWGVKGKVPGEHLDMINNHKNPMKIIGIDSDLRDHIVWHLKEIKPGYVYRLEVEDISEAVGDYTGHLVVRTDQPEKPELIIIINGHVSEK
ncbi:MAG: hypothetical protein JRJ21_04700 [Deltaproteobacteria bacterium]|nr:hypothetical protein [Deltaproteobacteria bacterium]